MQKGFIQFIILGIGVLVLVATGAFYLGRQSLPKPVQPANPVVTSQPTQFNQPAPIVTPSPTVNQQPQESNVTLPVIQLKTGYGIVGENGQSPSYNYPANITVSIPLSYSGKVSAYGVGEKVIIAPSGWIGEGNIGADGSMGSNLHPQNGSSTQGSYISVGEVPGCVSCSLGEAAPYFPEAKTLYKKDFPTPLSIPTGLTIKPISSSLVRYSLPNTLDGMAVNGVAYFKMTDTQPYFIKMEVILPQSQSKLSEFLLNSFIKRQNLK